MSIEAFSWALRVPIGGNAKVVLLGLANHAHPDGTETYPSLDTLATYAHCDRSTARRNVRKLQDEGWITEDGYGPKGQVKYRLAIGGKMPRGANREGVANGYPPEVAPVPPEPSLGTIPSSTLQRDVERNGSTTAVLDASETQRVASAGAREGARGGGFKHGRAGRVSDELAESAERVLRAFNEATGSAFRARKRNGDPTAELKQVAGAMLDREEVTEAEWVAGVRAMAASPPDWIEGAWIVGHMFGQKSSAHTLARARTPIVAAAAPTGRPHLKIVNPRERVDWTALAEDLRARGL